MLLDRSAMSCASQGWVFIAVLLSGLGAGGSSAFAQGRGGRWYDLEHLTGPSTRDPAQTYRRYLERNRDRMGMTNVDLDKLVVRNRYISSRTGTTHLYMRQQIHGIPVEGTDRVAAVDRRGRLLSQHGRPAWAVASKPVLTRRPGLSASAATQWAALGLGLNGSADIQVLKRHQGATQATDLSANDLSPDDIPAKLAYLISEEDSLQLTWNIVLRPIDGRHWWNLFVDAETGEILRREDWMHHDTYNVFPSPLQSALDGARVLTTDAADAKASPFGWHDTDGVAGAEFNDTQGNNVRAQEDSDGDNFGGLRPDGGAARTFDSPVDLSAHPSNYQDAAVTNLSLLGEFPPRRSLPQRVRRGGRQLPGEKLRPWWCRRGCVASGCPGWRGNQQRSIWCSYRRVQPENGDVPLRAGTRTGPPGAGSSGYRRRLSRERWIVWRRDERPHGRRCASSR